MFQKSAFKVSGVFWAYRLIYSIHSIGFYGKLKYQHRKIFHHTEEIELFFHKAPYRFKLIFHWLCVYTNGFY